MQCEKWKKKLAEKRSRRKVCGLCSAAWTEKDKQMLFSLDLT
jgi:hypothetical protein